MNCSIGSVESDAIGTADWDFEDTGGECFREICDTFQLFVPSTFDQFHSGGSATFKSCNGRTSRLDYIAVSKDCRDCISTSYVDHEIDLMNGDLDHNVLCLQLHVTCSPNMTQVMQRKLLYDRKAAKCAKIAGATSFVVDAPACQWSSDINTHWDAIRGHVQHKVAIAFPCQKRSQRQRYFSAQAWDLLCYRKELRKEHRALQRGRTLAVLRKFFTVWKDPEKAELDFCGSERNTHINRLQEALLLHMRAKVDRKFRSIKRLDWRNWIAQQLEEKIQDMRHAKASEIYQILKPKKMIAQKKGLSRKPLPGLKDQVGNWCSSRQQVALAWDKQFSKIEHAEEITFTELLKRSTAQNGTVEPNQLHGIPSLLDLERCIMELNDGKATGLDGIGAEIWQCDTASTARKLYPMVLKAAIRKQHVVEWTGGWILPLYKGKGAPNLMSGYRAILLEPSIARAVSKSWRKYLVRGLERISAPLQHGGRKGIGIEPLHLILQMWQSNARVKRASLGIAYVDIQSAFYSIFKPLLASYNGTMESVATIFKEMQLPATAFQSFLEHVGCSDLVRRATNSALTEGHVASSLAQTWFATPGSKTVRAPRTGTRPGDPCADILFSMVLTQVLGHVKDRAQQAGIALQHEAGSGQVTSYITWVDDLALSVMEKADKVVASTAILLSIVHDVLTEHGLKISIGRGKTAAMLDFKGPGAVECRQAFEKECGDMLPVLSEHHGMIQIPVVGRYKHLGGVVVPGGSKMTEIKIRGSMVKQNVAPLKSILSQPRIGIKQRRQLLRSLGMSVAKLHCGTWFNLTKGEIEAWHGVVFQMYQLLESRNGEGHVEHKELFELAHQAAGPMPIEFLYIERLRLLIHMISVGDTFVIAAVLHNYQLAQDESWLHGAIKAVKWAQTQIGKECVPEDLFDLGEWTTWHNFRDVAFELRKMLKKVEAAHQLRLEAYMVLKQQRDFQTEICKEMGWTFEKPEDVMEVEPQAECRDCGAVFLTEAALATHQQRKHGRRIALRRFAVDSTCRACARHFFCRTRLLQHLHWGRTLCWIYHFRRFQPMSVEETNRLDNLDKDNGLAMHQRQVAVDKPKRMWRKASVEEMQPRLEVILQAGDFWKPPDNTELERWATLGMLPPGKGGRPTTIRQQKQWKVRNVCRDISLLEQNIKDNVQFWKADFDWTPRPLSCGSNFFLVFFSGHRRWGDISSWFHWQGDITPVAVDLAVSKQHGHMMQHGLWQRLIRARRDGNNSCPILADDS